MTVGALTSDMRNRLNIPANVMGVVVTDIERGSHAAQEGFRLNDVILEMNRTPITSIADYNRVARSVQPGAHVLFLIRRDGGTFFRGVRIR